MAQRDEVQKAAELFSDLNIASTGQEKLTTLEWTGKLDREDRGEAILDSDDDEETDPLKIIAQGYTADKIVKYVKPERSLITEQDLKEIESFDREKHNGSVCSEASSTHSIELEPHALYLIEKTVDHPLTTDKFLPHKTTKSNVHDPEKEKLRKRGKYWENTAATPPPIMHSGTKMLSLQESIEVQADYEQRLKVTTDNFSFEICPFLHNVVHIQERLTFLLASIQFTFFIAGSRGASKGETGREVGSR